MNLSDEDKKQIEEEEAYRKQVREQENYRTQLHGNKKKGISWGTIILILLVIFVAFPVLGAIILIKINPAKYSNDSEQKVVASPSPIINSVSIVSPKTTILLRKWKTSRKNITILGLYLKRFKMLLRNVAQRGSNHEYRRGKIAPYGDGASRYKH